LAINEENNEEDEDYVKKNVDENKMISCSDATTTLHIKQGTYNAKRKVSRAILNPNDSCPICMRQWDQFVDNSIVAILECSHTCCATCLFNLHKECQTIEENYQIPFSCSLCRLALKPTVLSDLANMVVNASLIASFGRFVAQTGLLDENEDVRRNMVVNLLLDTCEFDVCRTESKLYELLQMILHDSSQALNSAQKSEYFELAREPVRRIENECVLLRSELNGIYDNESQEWKNKYLKLQRLAKQLTEARENATKDIFERMNSAGDMGAFVPGRGLHVDLHGLFINEAKEKIEELFLPVLPAVKKIVLITGRGVHNPKNEAKLKNALKDYFASVNIKCEEVKGNEGALCIFDQQQL
jgi:DNA-nicking Smr family endonuclease